MVGWFSCLVYVAVYGFFQIFGAGFICFTPQVGMIVPAIALLLAASPMTKDSRREDVVWGLVSVGDDKRVQLHGKGYFLDCACFFFWFVWKCWCRSNSNWYPWKKNPSHSPDTFFFPSQSENLLPRNFAKTSPPRGRFSPIQGPSRHLTTPQDPSTARGAGGYRPGSQCLDVGSCTLDLEDVGDRWCFGCYKRDGPRGVIQVRRVFLVIFR